MYYTIWRRPDRRMKPLQQLIGRPKWREQRAVKRKSGLWSDENISPRVPKDKIIKVKGNGSNIGCLRDCEERR